MRSIPPAASKRRSVIPRATRRGFDPSLFTKKRYHAQQPSTLHIGRKRGGDVFKGLALGIDAEENLHDGCHQHQSGSEKITPEQRAPAMCADECAVDVR